MEQVGERNVLERFEELFGLAQQSPVVIRKDEEDAAVLMSKEEYDRLLEVERSRVLEAENEGQLSPEEPQEVWNEIEVRSGDGESPVPS